MVGERLKGRFDREPAWRRLKDRATEPGHNIRTAVGGQFGDRIPEFENRNFGGGIGVGTVGAALATVLEDVVGVPFGGSADTVGVNVNSDGSIDYTVNVNSPTEDMAKVRAFLDAGTGFTSLLTDQLDVEDVELVTKRPARDTYQVKLRITP